MVKLEVGKYYKTRDGRKVGPMIASGYAWLYEDDQNCRLWNSDGSGYYGDTDGAIIAEWTEEPTGPVRTVTRKEIVPGVYGNVEVYGVGDFYIRQSNATELRAAITTLTEIADALEQQ